MAMIDPETLHQAAEALDYLALRTHFSPGMTRNIPQEAVPVVRITDVEEHLNKLKAALEAGAERLIKQSKEAGYECGCDLCEFYL